MKMGPIRCPETSVKTRRRVITQKTTDFRSCESLQTRQLVAVSRFEPDNFEINTVLFQEDCPPEGRSVIGDLEMAVCTD